MGLKSSIFWVFFFYFNFLKHYFLVYLFKNLKSYLFVFFLVGFLFFPSFGFLNTVLGVLILIVLFVSVLCVCGKR